ncbi:hypothetical protein AX16_001094, partial [Volvariella volvacea WC 439]
LKCAKACMLHYKQRRFNLWGHQRFGRCPGIAKRKFIEPSRCQSSHPHELKLDLGVFGV